MRFDKKNLNCAKQLVSFISSYVNPRLVMSTNIDEIIPELNKFLDVTICSYL